MGEIPQKVQGGEGAQIQKSGDLWEESIVVEGERGGGVHSRANATRVSKFLEFLSSACLIILRSSTAMCSGTRSIICSSKSTGVDGPPADPCEFDPYEFLCALIPTTHSSLRVCRKVFQDPRCLASLQFKQDLLRIYQFAGCCFIPRKVQKRKYREIVFQRFTRPFRQWRVLVVALILLCGRSPSSVRHTRPNVELQIWICCFINLLNRSAAASPIASSPRWMKNG